MRVTSKVQVDYFSYLGASKKLIEFLESSDFEAFVRNKVIVRMTSEKRFHPAAASRPERLLSSQ